MDAVPALARQHVRPGETVLWHARPSLIGLLPILTYAAAAFVGIGVSTYYGIEDPGAIFRGSAALTLAVIGVLFESVRRFIRLRFTIFVVTDERFYAITSFFETNARSVPLSRATHVSLRQGVAGRILGFWHAHVSTYGTGARGLDIPAIRDGEGLLREMSAGMRRGANVAWLRRGD
jgi:uncharacterized membrane protein YdbT with pleckstrin-like domain